MRVLREAGRLGGVALLASTLIASDSRVSPPHARGILDDVEPQDRRCAPASVPNPLPDVATIVDIESLRSTLAVELAAAPSAGVLPFSVRFAPSGQVEWAERIRSATEPPSHPGVQRLIAEHLKPQPRGRVPWSVRLIVVAGDSIEVRIGRSELCPVERIESGATRTESRTVRLSMEEVTELRRVGEFRVEVDVSATGSVLRAAIAQSSGSRFADDNALRAAREAKYRPALLDGIPVAGLYELMSRTRTRRR